jgi:DNA invertase Pin-like site-specific DNA recombinase
MNKTATAYVRASSNPKQQKNSIAVQTAIIERFAIQHGYSISKTFVEYHSGTDDERPQFAKSLANAIENDEMLISIRVDRLARSLSIFSKIQNDLHRLRFCELGDTEPNLMVLSVLLAVARQESINTSSRIKATYRALKDANPNLKWGNPRMAKDVQPLGEAKRVANAQVFNSYIKSVCSDLIKAGYCTISKQVIALNRLGIKTRRGQAISYANLHRILNYGV